MPTKTEIANATLRHLGARHITSLEAQNEDARTLRDAWLGAVRYCLEQQAWNFAIRRAHLSPTTAPVFGKKNSFPKPADCLRIASVRRTPEEDDLQLESYSDEGGCIITNEPSCFLRYVSTDYIEREGEWTQSFADFLALELAFRCAVRITGSREMRDEMHGLKRKYENAASTLDAIQQPAKRMPHGRWSQARRSRGYGWNSGMGDS